MGSLFINRKAVLPIGEWMQAKNHRTKGFSERPMWHCLPEPNAPHLSPKGRAWFEVQITGVKKMQRPEAQGGLWLLAQRMKIMKKL